MRLKNLLKFGLIGLFQLCQRLNETYAAQQSLNNIKIQWKWTQHHSRIRFSVGRKRLETISCSNQNRWYDECEQWQSFSPQENFIQSNEFIFNCNSLYLKMRSKRRNCHCQRTFEYTVQSFLVSNEPGTIIQMYMPIYRTHSYVRLGKSGEKALKRAQPNRPICLEKAA